MLAPLLPLLPAASLLGLLGFTAVAAVYDAKHYEIPNLLNITGGGVGLALHVAASLGAAGGAAISGAAGSVAVGAALAAAVALPLWRAGALGGGDVKLLVASSVFVGPLFTLKMLSCSLLAFVLLALCSFWRDGRLGEALGSSWWWFTGGEQVKADAGQDTAEASVVPFGPALFAGVCAALVLG